MLNSKGGHQSVSRVTCNQLHIVRIVLVISIFFQNNLHYKFSLVFNIIFSFNSQSGTLSIKEIGAVIIRIYDFIFHKDLEKKGSIAKWKSHAGTYIALLLFLSSIEVQTMTIFCTFDHPEEGKG